MKLFRFFFLTLFIAGAFYLLKEKVPQAPSLDPSPLPAPLAWQEVGRKLMLDQSWDMSSATVWVVPGVPHAPHGIRVFLEGSFESSNPGVKVMVGKLPSGSSAVDSASLGPHF